MLTQHLAFETHGVFEDCVLGVEIGVAFDRFFNHVGNTSVQEISVAIDTVIEQLASGFGVKNSRDLIH